ncbi:acylphosphatase-2 isoform X2 [Drosophila guanche]|uniref:acylphosphatase-2 isoform X2 n=1 Tax=Drosophila guanche TaxID=7266 RepID=UPI00147142CF|nr:acylphosphatase-2 isoform X2 [Drosophila guanche]
MNNKITKSTAPPRGKTATDGENIFGCQFEVFGKHTNNKAKQLGLVGWCMNTDEGSVKGVMEGSLDNITEMKSWLQHTGSPRSVIQKAVFSSNEPLASSNFKTFSIRR